MKKALITGCSHGIGKEITEYLLERNYYVVGVDKQESEDTYDRERFRFVRTDVSNPKEVEDNLDEKILGEGLDLLVNNAGEMIRKSLQELTWNEWNHIIHTNLSSVFLLSKRCQMALEKNKGHIINISSTRSFMSEPDTESYAASKGGINALTHAMAISLGPDIKVNCISPGWIYTGKEELREIDHQQHPAGRVGTTQDIAKFVHYLAENDGFITGSNFVIDGGMTKKMIYED